MKLLSPLEQAYEVIENLLNQEIQEDGLLHDVETFITSSETKDILEIPLIWLEKETITTNTTSIYQDTTILNLSFSLVCCAEVVDEFKDAENDSLNLANRCITSIFKNVLQSQEHIKIKGFQVDSIDPTGTFEIINKTMILPATRVQLTFQIELDWMIYKQDEETISFCKDDFLEDYELELNLIQEEHVGDLE